MKIKVKQKKGTYTSMVPGLIATIFFFLFGGGMLFFSLVGLFDDFTFDNFIVVFSEAGMATLFGLAFFLLSLYLMFFLFRGAKKYAAILKKIDIIEEKGKATYNYEFEIIGENDSVFDKYKCYTERDYNLELEKTYGLRIKQFNWKVKAIEEIDENVDVIKPKKNNNELVGLNIVCYVFFLIFGGGILFLIIKIFYDFANGNNEFLGNIIGIMGCSLFFGTALYLYIIERYNSKSLEEKIEYDKDRISKKLQKEDNVKKIVSNVQYNGASNIDLNNVTGFIVSRAPFNEQDNYEVIDDHYESKLYQVVNDDKKYYLNDSIDCVVAEIKIDKSYNGLEIIFIPISGSSFAIYYKGIEGYGFKVLGRNYEVKVNNNVVMLSDGNGINIGTMQLEENLTFPRGKVEVSNTVNNEEIIMLCLGIVMIKYHYKKESDDIE